MTGDEGKAVPHPQHPLKGGVGPACVGSVSLTPSAQVGKGRLGHTWGQARFRVRASLLIPGLESKVEENTCLENPK